MSEAKKRSSIVSGRLWPTADHLTEALASKDWVALRASDEKAESLQNLPFQYRVGEFTLYGQAGLYNACTAASPFGLNSGGMTYGTQALTLLTARSQGSVRIELWYMVAPPLGTATLSWAKSGANQNSTWGTCHS